MVASLLPKVDEADRDRVRYQHRACSGVAAVLLTDLARELQMVLQRLRSPLAKGRVVQARKLPVLAVASAIRARAQNCGSD